MEHKKIVLATHNKGKIREFKELLKPLGIEAVGIKELMSIEEPEETGSTFEENTRQKAQYYMKACQLPCLADDSGLLVDALDGAPGVYSARYAGENASDEENNKKLVRELADVPFEKRTAHYACSLLLTFPDGRELVTFGTCNGYIQESPEGTNGFGYDPYFYLPDYKKTMAQLLPEEKNKISHRGHAIATLLKKLATYNW